MIEENKLKTLPEFDGHEKIVVINNKTVGLRGFIAIHNTNLGPATGGTRRWLYSSEEEAARDVLNLSRAMTYKCALAGVNFGGGKGVIIGSPKSSSKELLLAYAREVDKLGGKFTTGPDIGINEDDTKVMSAVTPYILGHRPTSENRQSTSDMAAWGVFIGIETAVDKIMNCNLKGLRVAVKGLGKLGGELVRLLVKAGAKVIAADIDISRVEKIKKDFPDVKIVPAHIIHSYEVDVYSPCAVGSDLTEQVIGELKAKLVVGGANNQLESSAIGEKLFNQGVFFAPDYVVNAGGLINIVDELEPNGYKVDRVKERVSNIASTLEKIIDLSKQNNQPSNVIADGLVKEIIYSK